MPKFYVHETQLCEVTFVREIDADDAGHARDRDLDECGRMIGVSIGDVSPMSTVNIDVLPAAPYNIPACFYPEDAEAVRALAADLWWFIENVNDDTPDRTDRFFALRERFRSLQS